MKLISLNTWGGRIFKPLLNFLKQQSADTDIFCLQEIYSSLDKKKHRNIRANLLEEIKKILPGYVPIFFPSLKGFDTEEPPEEVNFELEYGNAIFVKKDTRVKTYQSFFIYQDSIKLKNDLSNIPTPLQKMVINFNNENFAIFNFHGTSFPANKLDSENRLIQARKVRAILDYTKSFKIIIGDFNTLPETQSLQIISGDLRNLIKEYKIERTRSNLSPYFGKPTFQKFADYAFISKDINLKKFEVIENEVSDHLPLVIEIE